MRQQVVLKDFRRFGVGVNIYVSINFLAKSEYTRFKRNVLYIHKRMFRHGNRVRGGKEY